MRKVVNVRRVTSVVKREKDLIKSQKDENITMNFTRKRDTLKNGAQSNLRNVPKNFENTITIFIKNGV